MGGLWALFRPYFKVRSMLVSTRSVLSVMALARGTFGWGQIREIAEGYVIRGGQECSDYLQPRILMCI